MKLEAADALLFDLGNVVIDIDFERTFVRWAQYARCDVSSVRARFTQDAPYKLHEIGAISAEEYFASLRGSLGIDISNAQFLEGWNAMFIAEKPGMSTVLAAANERVPLYVFSNSNKAHELHWSKRFAASLQYFQKIFVSSTIGLRKPEPEAFQFVSKEIGVPARRIVFFDDVIENVEGARACGLQGVHVTSLSDVTNALAALRV